MTDITLAGLHLLLTYQCVSECDHCFVWGSPWQSGTMTLDTVRMILKQAQDVGSVRSIYFEGGEPFLYYAVLVRGVREACELGFKVGIVSHPYWATSLEDAMEWLKPLAGLLQDLSVSSDLYHADEKLSASARVANEAAGTLGIPVGIITCAQPEETKAAQAEGQLPHGESAVMYRGRAAEKLVDRAIHRPWEQFTECPHENLRQPGRVHIDPLGYVHVCQGISMGNVFTTPLRDMCAGYHPDEHPIIGPLLSGGPAELVRRYGLSHQDAYADACHLCYETRLAMRSQFPDTLAPHQMYGVVQ